MLFAFIAVILLGNAKAKPIRLLTGTIDPDSPSSTKQQSVQPAGNDYTPVSGLYLIQFTDAPKPAWRGELRNRGIELLRYVPENTFVARFNNAQPAEIRNLSYVHWFGKYQADYKLHPQLITAGPKSPLDLVYVAILLSPLATESETVRTKNAFQYIRQESRSRFGRIVRGRITRSQMELLAQSDSVLWIEPAPQMKLFDEASSKIVAGDGGPNMLATQTNGFDGSGVTVAVVDTGLDTGDTNTMHPDLFGRVAAFFKYGPFASAADEHGHGTHCAGIIAGNGATGETDTNGNLYGLGVAPAASIVAQRLFDAEGNEVNPAPDFETLTSDAQSVGADVGSNSWGDDRQGRYDLNAAEFDALVRDANSSLPGDQPYSLVFANGNAGPGPQTVASPAVSKNVIAVGAAQSSRTNFGYYTDGINSIVAFSSRGPCEDGRIKPDVVAPGTWIASLKSQASSDAYAWLSISSNYVYEGGTSQAAPHVAGAAAVFIQFYRQSHTNTTPSPALVKAALINSAVDLNDPTQTAPAPNNDEGWGRVDLTKITGGNRSCDFVDQNFPLTNGQTFERKILVSSSSEPLKVTLAYTDVPGFPGAIPALVNDLNLEVIAPNGKSYHGNQFSQGKSVPGASGWDDINNVEGVFIAAPPPGQYTVKVYATNIVADARADTAETDQDFALVSSGNLATAGQSIVILDRQAYTAPSALKITVIDPDAVGSNSVTVLAQSDTEPLGENYLLLANGASVTFTGSVATATGIATTDGKLQITHGDAIEVHYLDASSALDRVASAVADLVPPVLSGAIVTNQFGNVVVNWNSDEPANSVVRFDTNLPLAHVAFDKTLSTEHSVALDGLVSGATYYFSISSADEAGNTSTNDNGGALFQFVAEPPATVLLVDDYHLDLYDNLPPLTNYTVALDALGVRYDVWNADPQAQGSPELTDLLAYRVVIWRLPEFSGTWSPEEQNTLANYLASGGSLFVASMQVLSRLDDPNDYSAFRKNTLKVLSYSTNVTVPQIVGVPNDPIGNGISRSLNYEAYASEAKTNGGVPIDVSDTFVPTPDASPVFYKDIGNVCGLRYPKFGQDGAGRLVFLSFPLDAVPFNEETTNNRVQLLGNILRFLSPGFDGSATVTLDASAYTVPSLVTVEVDDPDQAGAGNLDVNFSSTTDTNITVLSLQETPRAGTFRGYLTLVQATNSSAPETLRALNGDVIRADYFDVSTGQTNTVSAIVDSEPPVITNLSATPSYVQATIQWSTTEPCDALVQYGETPLSFQTAYDPSAAFSHQIIINNLKPSTVYYFRVVSVDAAGNATTSDNDTFTTLEPILSPWEDDLDGSSPGWTVSSSETSGSVWTRGIPDNGVVTNAHSYPNAWGSNLSTNSLNEVDTLLTSPAVLLVGGNKATLTFWHKYDFSDITGSEIQDGVVTIITNGLGSSIQTSYHNASVGADGWQKVEMDLTPYIGQVVNVQWHYTLSSVLGVPRTGWLIDDVSLIVSNTTPGTIFITNNLWQANFSMTGPSSASGRGAWMTITNTPPGQYVVEYSPVTYYQTPPPQTNDLPPGKSIVFHGNYSFADANSNGISDGWELLHFGDVSSNRTSTTDTDGDGVSDYKEFLSGTDPNGPLPPFQVTASLLPDGSIELQWPSAPGHAYYVQGSLDFSYWYNFSGWIFPTGPSTNFVFQPDFYDVQFFRVKGSETAGFFGPATFLTITTTLLEDGSVQLTWPSAVDYAYRVDASSDAVSWMPYSDWIQANDITTSFTIPPSTNGAPYLFRVEVAP